MTVGTWIDNVIGEIAGAPQVIEKDVVAEAEAVKEESLNLFGEAVTEIDKLKARIKAEEEVLAADAQALFAAEAPKVEAVEATVVTDAEAGLAFVKKVAAPVVTDAVAAYTDVKTEAGTLFTEGDAAVTAFATHTAIEAKIGLGKERIAVVDAYNTVNTDALAFLESEWSRVGTDASALKLKVEALLAKL